MKKFRLIFLDVVIVLVNTLYSVLPFLNIYVTHSAIPGYDGNGNSVIVRRKHVYSFYNLLKDNGFSIFVYACIAIACVSVLLLALKYAFKKNKVLWILSLAFLGLATVAFIAVLFMGFVCTPTY